MGAVVRDRLMIEFYVMGKILQYITNEEGAKFREMAYQMCCKNIFQ